MDLFRNAFNIWARRDSQAAPSLPEPEMPLPLPRPRSLSCDADSPANPNPNPSPPSSALSSLGSTVSFVTTASASPDDRRAKETAAAVDGSGEAFLQSGGEQEDEDEDGTGHDDSGECQSDLEALRRHYRPKKALPPELKEHCRVYLEEALRMSPRLRSWHQRVTASHSLHAS